MRKRSRTKRKRTRRKNKKTKKKNRNNKKMQIGSEDQDFTAKAAYTQSSTSPSKTPILPYEDLDDRLGSSKKIVSGKGEGTTASGNTGVSHILVKCGEFVMRNTNNPFVESRYTESCFFALCLTGRSRKACFTCIVLARHRVFSFITWGLWIRRIRSHLSE